MFKEWILQNPAVECIMYLCTEAIAPSPARKSNEALLRAHTAAAAPACYRVLTCSHVTAALQVLVSTIMVWILFQKKQPNPSTTAARENISLPALAVSHQAKSREKLLNTAEN